jgi:lipopolysaccharide biosynthesis glycosyltransferase
VSNASQPVFFLTFDKGYLVPAAAAIHSLLSHHQGLVVKIYLLVGEHDTDWIQPLVRLIEDAGATAQLKTVANELFSDLKFNLQFTSATYYRVMAGAIFEESKIIYLDSDILVHGSLVELWETDLKAYPLAAVSDPLIQDFHRLNLEPAQGYFNSGIMLLNLDRWRELGLGEQVLTFIKKFPNKVHYADQCGLNAVLKGNWMRLAPKWNLQTAFVEKETLEDCKKAFSQKELDEALHQPKIIHFTGRLKPWNLGCNHPLRKQFWLNLDQTPFKRRLPLDFSFLNLIKSFFPLAVKKYYWRQLHPKQTPAALL